MPSSVVFQSLFQNSAKTGILLQQQKIQKTPDKTSAKKKNKAAPVASDSSNHRDDLGAAPGQTAGRAQDPCVEDQAVESRNKHMFSMMQAGAAALASERNWEGSALLEHLVRPMAEDHRFLVQQLSSGASAARAVYIDYFSGGRASASHRVFAVLQDGRALQECGLLLQFETESHCEACMDDPDTLQQDAAACRMDCLAFYLVQQRSVAALQFTDSIQGILAAFVSSRSDLEARALVLLQTKSDVFLAASQQNLPTLDKWLDRSEFRRPVENRVLKALQESEFATVPPAVRRDATDLYSGEFSTLIVENAFKELRAAEQGQMCFVNLVR